MPWVGEKIDNLEQNWEARFLLIVNWMCIIWMFLCYSLLF